MCTCIAAGVLSLLDETDPQLQTQALEILAGIVDEFWAEISDYIGQMYVAYGAGLNPFSFVNKLTAQYNSRAHRT